MAIDRIRGSGVLDSTIGTDDIANDAVTTAKLGNVTDIASSSAAMTLSPAGTEILNVGTTGDVTVKGQGSNRGMLVLRAGSNTSNSQLRFGDQATDLAGRIMYDHTDNFMRVDVNEAERMRIDNLGRVTLPSQPCFSATATTTNIPLTTQTTITLSSERFDVGGHLSGNTFTAPVTGKYLFTYLLYYTQLDASHTTLDVHIKTSNKQYQQTWNPSAFMSSDSNFSVSGSVIADMDANDTCFFRTYVSGGGAQTDIHGDSQISGCLLL